VHVYKYFGSLEASLLDQSSFKMGDRLTINAKIVQNSPTILDYTY
jgi:hypothetical protein